MPDYKFRSKISMVEANRNHPEITKNTTSSDAKL